MLNVDEPLADGCMGATEVAFKIRKRYQTNELIVDSTEFGTRGSEVQILSPRPNILQSINCGVFENLHSSSRLSDR